MIADLPGLLKKVAVPGAEWMGIREVRERTIYVSARDGKPERNAVMETRGLMVEALAGGQFGYCSTPALDEASVRRAAQAALAQANGAAPFGVHRLGRAVRPPSRGEYVSPHSRPIGSISLQELSDLTIRISSRLRVSDKIARSTSLAQVTECEMQLVHTDGGHVRQKFLVAGTDFEAMARDGSNVQKRSDAGSRGRTHQGGLELLETADLWERVERTGAQALELLSAPECPSDTRSLVLMPDQMMLQIHESIGHPLELDRILGDERNYAGSSFVKLADFGTLQYGSALMNVTFDPGVDGELASFGFDDTGAEAKRELLIEKGLLRRALGGLESQARAGVPGVSCVRATSWNRAPIDRMANLNLEPGASSFDDVIGSVERGVLMETNRSWSIDDFRRKFQFGCEYGRLIEDGRLGPVVKNPNYRGVTVPFWRNLKRVGDRSTFGVFGTPNCGKGEPNQVIRCGHGSPVCLFDGIEVFGGA